MNSSDLAFSETFRQRLMAKREQHGHSHYSLALAIGVHRNSILGWEKMGRLPYLSAFRALCVELDCDPNYLLGLMD